jgi:Flp pilus assembly protein TadG
MMERKLSKSKQRRSSERGSTLVEGALCFTVFLMIIFATIDFGRMVFAYNFISYSAREAARYALAHGTKYPVTAANLTTFVKNEAIGLDRSAITVTPTWSDVSHTPGTSVQVQVQYAFQPIAPYMPAGLLTMSSTSKMLISQ